MESEWDQAKISSSLKQISNRKRMELDTCAHCGLCTGKCPTYAGSGEANYSPSIRASKMLRLMDKKDGILTRFLGQKDISVEEFRDLSDSVYNCTLCGRCMETCPFGFQTHELWVSLRGIIHSMGCQNANVARMERQLEETRNPYGLDSDTRLDWVDYTSLDQLPIKEKAEVAFWVGCTTAFKGANQNVAFCIANILNHVKEDWTSLGDKEWCCGSPVLLSGDEEKFREYVEHNVALIEKLGVKRVITGCSGCYRILKWEYPTLLKKELPFEVIHVVEYIRDKIDQKQLSIEKLDKKITYHDPCELARLGGIVNAPREILRSFAGNFVEINENKLDSRCCGGGGLLHSSNSDLRLAVVKNRLEQVKDTGAEILTSSCPACKLAYLDGVREFGYKIEVLDLVELVARQMKIS